MVLTPALLTISLEDDKLAAVQGVMRNPYFGMATLLFVGMLMASRLPTISLKALRVSKRALPGVVAMLLLLIGALFAYRWLVVGVLGLAYVLTVPVTYVVFAKLRAKYDRGLTSNADKS
jgi:phosphatidylserine synthase